jgi:DNA-binding helix-hairpin-helix protein with protein kinase domain
VALMPVVELLPNDRNLPSQLAIAGQPAHEGGEAGVYPTLDGKYVAKIYHRAAPDREGLLQQIVHLGTNLGMDERFLAWPLAIVRRVDGNPCTGVVTRRVPDSHVPLHKLISTPLDAADQFKQGWSWLDYLRIARGAAIALRTIHSKGMAHADIHFKNLLVDAVSGDVVLIDLDGLVVRGFLPPQVKGMPGFIAPEVVMGKAEPGELSDRHSIAVLILWTLLFRNVMASRRRYDDADRAHDDELAYGAHACFSENPNDQRNWIPQIGAPLFRGGLLSYRMLPPALRELTERALIDGLHDPPKRPHVVEWEQALAETSNLIATCSVCRQAWPYPCWVLPVERRQCPFCGSTVQGHRPAVIELLDETASRTHVPVRSLVLEHRRSVYSDALEPGTAPPFSRRGVAVVGDAVWDAQAEMHRLINTSHAPWVVGDGNEAIRPGGSVLLRPGMMLRFGDGLRSMRVVE